MSFGIFDFELCGDPVKLSIGVWLEKPRIFEGPFLHVEVDDVCEVISENSFDILLADTHAMCALQCSGGSFPFSMLIKAGFSKWVICPEKDSFLIIDIDLNFSIHDDVEG